MNLLGNVAGKLSDNFQTTKEKLEQISKVLRKVPDILTFSFSGKKSANLPKITSGNFKLYIGQIFEDGGGLYDEEFIIGALKTYLERLENGEKLIIENSSLLSWIINGLKEDEGALDPDYQIKYIEQLIQTYFPEQTDKIEVKSIHEHHKELLSTIEEEGLEGLKSDENIGLNKNFTSLDIAKLLYNASQKSDNFFTRLVSTMKKRKGVVYTKKNLESYYTLVEIAIRLTDFVNGINIQGGEERQSLYDHIIVDILNGQFDEIPEIKTIKEFCLSNAKFPFFRTLNFSKDKYKKEQERQEKERVFRKKANRIMLPVALFSMALIGGQIKSTRDNYIQEQQLDERINEVLMEALKDKTIFTYFKPPWGARYETENEKIEYLNSTGERLVKFFIARYGEGKASEKELKLFLIRKIIALMSFPFYEDMGGEKSYIQFLEKVLQDPDSKIELISMGYDIENHYLKYQAYNQAFSTTYTYKGDLKQIQPYDFVNSNFEYIDSKGNTYQVNKHTCKTFSPPMVSDGCLLNMSLGDTYILARMGDYGDYNLVDGKKIALDYLSSPFNSLIKKIIMTGVVFGDNFFSLEGKIRERLANLVLEKKYSVEQIKSWGTVEIIAFLQNNFKEHLSVDFQEIAENTLNLNDDLKVNGEKLLSKKVGELKIGELDYTIVIFELNGKKYFYLDMLGYNYGEGLNLYGFSPSQDLKLFLQDLLKLL